MIALAGIIVRNSILLVDFINLQLRQGPQASASPTPPPEGAGPAWGGPAPAPGMTLERAVVASAVTRAQPILLTGLAAMAGALFILDDPIFNGLAISLIFGILVSTLLTLVVIPLLYYVAYRHRLSVLVPQPSQGD
jgi:multidrug efflux pump subunit AcrB